MKLDINEIRKSTSLEIIAKQLVEGFITGLHQSPYHGFSVEFAEHRLYNEGESTRHIDWKVYARTDRMFTKRYEEETNLRCLVALDCSGSMHYPQEGQSKILFSIYAAAALSYLLQRQRDAVGLCLFSDTIETLTAIKSTPTHLNKLFTVLEQAAEVPNQTSTTSTNVASVLNTIAENTHRRSLIIIFTDMFDADDDTGELFKSLQHLKHNKHEVIVFHVMDKATELAFDFEDRPHEFIDLESNTRLTLNPNDMKEQYQRSIAAFHQEVKLKCHQYKIDYVEADVHGDFNIVLQTYLIKRGKMR